MYMKKLMGLDHASLVKLVPVGLGLSIFSNAFMKTSVENLHIYCSLRGVKRNVHKRATRKRT